MEGKGQREREREREKERERERERKREKEREVTQRGLVTVLMVRSVCPKVPNKRMLSGWYVLW